MTVDGPSQASEQATQVLNAPHSSGEKHTVRDDGAQHEELDDSRPPSARIRESASPTMDNHGSGQAATLADAPIQRPLRSAIVASETAAEADSASPTRRNGSEEHTTGDDGDSDGSTRAGGGGADGDGEVVSPDIPDTPLPDPSPAKKAHNKRAQNSKKRRPRTSSATSGETDLLRFKSKPVANCFTRRTTD